MVRDAIADPAVSLDCAAVAGAAGDEPLNPLGILSDEQNTVPGSVPTKLVIYCSNQLLISAKDELKSKACLKIWNSLTYVWARGLKSSHRAFNPFANLPGFGVAAVWDLCTVHC